MQLSEQSNRARLCDVIPSRINPMSQAFIRCFIRGSVLGVRMSWTPSFPLRYTIFRQVGIPTDERHRRRKPIIPLVSPFAFPIPMLGKAEVAVLRCAARLLRYLSAVYGTSCTLYELHTPCLCVCCEYVHRVGLHSRPCEQSCRERQDGCCWSQLRTSKVMLWTSETLVRHHCSQVTLKLTPEQHALDYICETPPTLLLHDRLKSHIVSCVSDFVELRSGTAKILLPYGSLPCDSAAMRCTVTTRVGSDGSMSFE